MAIWVGTGRVGVRFFAAHGNEVLCHACEFKDPTGAILVIDAGARQDLVDYDLGRALDFPNPEMIEMFCTHGARTRPRALSTRRSGAAGRRRRHEPEGGPSMRTIDEIPRDAYAEIVRVLVAAGGGGGIVLERIGDDGARGTTLDSELSLDLPP